MQAQVFVDSLAPIGKLDRRIYGQFIEHLGRCIYGGIWVGEESGIPNYKGFRSDVISAVRELRPPVVRWPGGNFSSAYHWEDGVGPRESRPRRFEMAWEAVEPNQFGTDEFIEWCRLVGAEPFIVVNAGNGTPEEAARWVEYCNSGRDTHYAQLRGRNGHPEPYNVKLWGIGNELYGRWQVGFCMDGEECARRTMEFANEMRRVDPGIELVGVGCDYDPEWNVDMVRLAGEYIDYLSIHTYIGEKPYGELAAAPVNIEGELHAIYRLVEATRRRWRIKRRIRIAFDEWNVWYPEAKPPLLEQVTGVRDAVFTALVLNLLQRLCNEVAIACFAQTVNVLPLLITREDGSMLLSPQYLAFKLYVQNTGDTVIRTTVDAPHYQSSELGRPVCLIDASATLSDDAAYIHLVNRSEDERVDCTVSIRGMVPAGARHLYVSGDSVEDRNTFEDPYRVTIEENREVRVDGSTIKLSLNPHSVNIIKVPRLK